MPVTIAVHHSPSVAASPPALPCSPHDVVPTEPARKPLYILTTTQARMKSGRNYFVLMRAGVATAFYPAARIAHIICNRHLDWSGEALALCLAHGITITWIGDDGRALGNSQNLDDDPNPANSIIKHYTQLPDWTERFGKWLIHRRREVFAACFPRGNWWENPSKAEKTEAVGYDFIHKGRHETYFPDAGQGWMHARTLDYLHRNGLRSIYWGMDGNPLELARHLAALLWAELNFDCGPLPASCRDTHLATRFFEDWAHQHADRLPLHLGDFKRHVWRSVYPWH
jgi:hypothetical protein